VTSRSDTSRPSVGRSDVSRLFVGQLVEVARRAAAAGAAELTRPPRTVQVKGWAGDVVTDVDLRAEQAVRATLREARPTDAITGEELEDSTGTELRWSIDPLDGTTNYVRGLPHYATSVAAVSVATGRWLAAAVHAPRLGDVYWAGLGTGAYRSRDGRITQLSGPAVSREAPLLGTGFSYEPAIRDEQLRELAARLPRYADIRRLGSAALEICLVADGTLDAYVERDLAEHDWAAAALIAAEAGVPVTRPATPTAEVRIGRV
jgi:myo-inositol-1(or 4)-monophosphatase